MKTIVTANQTSGQKNEPRSTSAQIPYSVHHNELQWVTVRWNTVSYYEILWMRSCHLTSAMFSTIWWYVLWQVSGRVALHGMMLSRCFAPWRENKHQIGEITKHIQSVSLGCFDHAHEESARICTLIRRRKEKILTVDHKRLNGAFCKIICHFHFGMI